MFRHSSRGQSTLEYVILLGFVVAALIAMGVYMKRGFEGKLRSSTDDIGEQYSAGYTTGSFSTTITQQSSETTSPSGGSSSTTTARNRSGSETVAPLASQ